ncbi:glycosyltransferase family 4 protein [Pseudomonas benzenivorans]|uniref:Glycosyltransferase family 4 protein n=1 Tax=Pseudomonas benzenivorans TaxID=556533 RepID=A0ABZ0Q025_9PSED|nr:glycosyltransferase family 4 protein [Pseudomonas benzenivorans]WPC06779.1 glycosyltransferase family 4 protein [Pseudomonas benzenivorans]
MKMLFISQLFDPEYSIKGLGFLQEMQKQGFEVEVITTFPSYPVGKVFPGYKLKPWQVETHSGIRVIRVYSFISHSKSKFSRALNYFSFMVTSFLAMAVMRKPDVVYAYHPQVTTGIVASIFKVLRGVPFVTDVQDLWPDALAATGTQGKGFLYSMINKLCNFVYKQSDHVVVLSRGYRGALIDRGVPAEKISVVYNWHASEGGADAEGNERVLPSGFEHTFVYAGNLGAAQSLKSVISAFSRCVEKSVCLAIIGSGVEKDELVAHAQSIGANNVFFLGYVSPQKVIKYLTQADVLVVHLKDEPLFKITIPSKIQAYLNSRKPLLMAVGGEANQIVNEARAGVCAEPDNISSIELAIAEMLDKKDAWQEMGESGRCFYETEMSQRKGVVKIVSALRQLQC